MRTSLSKLFLTMLVVLQLAFEFGCASNEISDLLLPFDGTLSTESGISPVESSMPVFASFRKKKVLRVGKGWTAKYENQGFDSSNGTLQFWIKPDSFPDGSEAITFCGEGQRPCFSFSGFHRALGLTWRFDPGSKVKTVSVNDFPMDRWTMITLVWQRRILSGMDFVFYINGRSQDLNEVSAATRLPDWQDGRIQIGSSASSAEFKLRDLMVSSSIPAETEIIRRYAADVESHTRMEWSSSEMLHFTGRSVPDSEASNGEAWTGDTRLAYVSSFDLPSKNNDYNLVFRLKLLRPVAFGMIGARVFAVQPDGSQIEISTRSNNKWPTGKTDAYRNISLSFRSDAARIGWEFYSRIPGKHSLLLDTITLRNSSRDFEKEWNAVSVEHAMGIPQQESDSTSGEAWGNDNTLFYGPYTGIGYPGKYRVTWRYKISKYIAPGEIVAFFDIFAHDGIYADGRRGNRKYNELILNSSDVREREKWQSCSLNFRYDGADMMEFRVFTRHLDPGLLLLDTVIVERVD